MEIVTLFPCSVGGLLWEAKPSQWTLTVCVKSTLVLVDGSVAVPAEIQDPIFEDRPWDGESGASLFGPEDLVPLKPKVDILLSGHAYAPPGGPVRHFPVRVRVGDFEKQLEISGERWWVQGHAGISVSEPAPISRVAIRYEHAARSESNPVGILIEPMKLGGIAAAFIESAHGAAPGFGPYSPDWSSRRSLLSEPAFAWSKALLSSAEGVAAPAPADLDFRFFNAAPADQQIELLRPGITIELENLHPSHAMLRSNLPAGKPQAFTIDANSGRAAEIGLRCDTLWIHSDRGVAVLSYRGLCELSEEGFLAIAALVVVSNSKGRRVRREQVERAWQSKDLSVLAGDVDDPGQSLETRHDAVLSKASPAGAVAIGNETRRLAPGDDIRKEILPFMSDAKRRDPSSSDIMVPRSRRLDLGKPVTGETLRSAGQPVPAPATPFEGSSGIHSLPKSVAGVPNTLNHQDNTVGLSGEESAAAPRADTSGRGKIEAQGFEPAAPKMKSPSGEPGGTLRFSAGDASILKSVLPFQSKGQGEKAAAVPARSSPKAGELASVDVPALPARALNKPLGGETMRVSPKVVARAVMPFAETEKKEGVSKPAAAKTASPAPSPAAAKPKAPVPAPLRKALPQSPSKSDPKTTSVLPSKSSVSKAATRAPEKKAEGKGAPAKADPRTPDGKSASDFLFTMPVERYAALSAELSVRSGERAHVLGEQGLTEEVWAAVDDGWSERIANAVAEGDNQFLESFDVAYIASLERFGRRVDAAEYARILVGIERGEVGSVLLSLKLGLSDLVRIQRVWTKRLGRDAELALRVEKEAAALREKDG